MEQLNIRDLFINNANQELTKNNIKFEFNDPNLETKEEIEMEPYSSEKLKISPSYKSYNDINKKRNVNTIKSKKSDIESNKSNQNTIITDSESINLSRLKNLNRNDRFNDINKFRNKVKLNITKENNNNKDSSLSISKNNNNNIYTYKRNISVNQKGNTLINAGENAVQNNYKKVINRPTKQNYIIDNSEVNDDNNLLQNLMLKKRDNNNQNYKYNNYNNYSFYDLKKNPVQETNTTRLENEVQKK
jgi:hypothetical protein